MSVTVAPMALYPTNAHSSHNAGQVRLVWTPKINTATCLFWGLSDNEGAINNS